MDYLIYRRRLNIQLSSIGKDVLKVEATANPTPDTRGERAVADVGLGNGEETRSACEIWAYRKGPRLDRCCSRTVGSTSCRNRFARVTVFVAWKNPESGGFRTTPAPSHAGLEVQPRCSLFREESRYFSPPMHCTQAEANTRALQDLLEYISVR
jgi:hypothetical protein